MSTLIGDSSPTRRSKAPKVPQLDEGHTLAPKQLENPSLTFPVLSVTPPTSNTTTIAQSNMHNATQRRSNLALSPPKFTQTRPASRPSSGTSQAPSAIPSPFSQPQTPIPMPAPPLNITHWECYQGHRKIIKLSNKHYTVPCMVCKTSSKEDHWKCIWCCLWLCTSCAESLRKIDGRSLSVLVDKVVKKKENDRKAMGGKKEEITTEPAKEVCILMRSLPAPLLSHNQ